MYDWTVGGSVYGEVAESATLSAVGSSLIIGLPRYIFSTISFTATLFGARLMQAAMTIAMLVDAYRRGVEVWWYYLIFFLQPIGVWVYLFAVFLPRLDRTAWL